MRIVTNEKLAKRNRQIANYLFFGTMFVLIGSFFLVNQSLFTGEVGSPLILLAQAMALPVAFILTLFSVRMTNLWARPPRPEEALPDGLKGLSKKSILYNYYHFPSRHVLIAPQGVFSITTRWHTGKYTVNGGQWKSKQSMFAKVLSAMRMDGLGNPTDDAQHAVNRLQKIMDDIAPDVTVQPLIVFVSLQAEVNIEEPEIPVLFANEKQKPNLKDYMRKLNREADDKMTELPLTDAQIAAFEQRTLPQEKIEQLAAEA